MVAIPGLGVPVPTVVHHWRRHWRRRRHNGRGRRRRRRRRRSRAGRQCESRNKSGRAERPASRDKTHVSPPRVESDTLYQLDTQSRAAQDDAIIASSRLFSMGNLTPNHGNDDDPHLWRRRSPRWKAQRNPSAPGRGRSRLCPGRSGGAVHPNRRRRTIWAVRGLGHGRPAHEIRCAERQNPVGGNWSRYFVLGSRDCSTVARRFAARTRHGGNQRLSFAEMSDIAMSHRHSGPALPSAAAARRRVLVEALVLAAARGAGVAVRRRAGALGAADRTFVTCKHHAGAPET